MIKVRSAQQDERDDAFWHSNHEHRRAKARKTRHKGLNSSTIRQGIEDYFDTSSIEEYLSEDLPELDNVDYSQHPTQRPRI